MSRYNKILVDLIVAFALITAIVAAAFTIFGRPARGANLIYCAEKSNGGNSYWFYRIVDGRRCWFQARGLRRGQDMPREQLRWEPKPVIEDPPKPMALDEDLEKPELVEETDKPLDFDARWDGTKDGKGDRLK